MNAKEIFDSATYPSIKGFKNHPKCGTTAEPESSLHCSEFAAAFGDHWKEGVRVIDWGAGSGRFGNFMAQRLENFHYYGMQPNNSFGHELLKENYAVFGSDPRFRFDLITPQIKTLPTTDVVLLISIFTHITFDAYELLIKLFSKTSKCIVFSVFLAPEEGIGNLTDEPDFYYASYYNEHKFRKVSEQYGTLTKVAEIVAQGVNVHQIFRLDMPE